MPYLQVGVSDEQKTAITGHCGRVGMSFSAWARGVLVGHLRAVPEVPVQAEYEPDDGDRVAVMLRLTPTEVAALDRRAGLAGQKRATWATLAVRGVITGEPQPSEEERAQMNDATEDLASLARAIRSLVRAHQETGTPVELTVVRLERIETEVRTQLAALTGLVAASRERWKLLP